MRRPNRVIIGVATILMVLSSCKPKVPSQYIQPDKMEDILYDYHLANTLAQMQDEHQDYDSHLYRMGVLKKYGVTQAELDSSLVYYMRHADRLHTIYENIADRLNKEAMNLGASDAHIGIATTSGTDTVNVWKNADHFLLIPYSPYNKQTFSVLADTAFRKGDKMLLSFYTHFVYQDGTKKGIAQLSVRYDNDSVASRVLHLSSSMGYSVEIPNNDSLKIKEVSGFFYLGDDKSGTTTTLKMMFVNQVRLIRFHLTKQKSATTIAQPHLSASPRTIRPGELSQPIDTSKLSPTNASSKKTKQATADKVMKNPENLRLPHTPQLRDNPRNIPIKTK